MSGTFCIPSPSPRSPLLHHVEGAFVFWTAETTTRPPTSSVQPSTSTGRIPAKRKAATATASDGAPKRPRQDYANLVPTSPPPPPPEVIVTPPSPSPPPSDRMRAARRV